jgi:hypothetical protein
LLDEQEGDPAEDTASQADTDESAGTPAAPAKADGDSGSGKAVDAPAVEGKPGAPGVGDDPLAGTEPFTYTVNGETKTLDGVFRVPGEGLLVPEDKVQIVEQLAERADTLDRVSREYQSRNAEYERLSEWRTQGADGKEQVYQGRDGLVAMRVELGTRAASMDVLTSILKPNAQGQYVNLAKLVTTQQNARGELEIIPDPDVLERLLLQSDLAERDARDAIFREVGQLSQPSTSTSSAPDYSAQAAQVIEAAAQSGKFDSKALTDRDKGFLAAQLPRYVRTVTEDDRRMNPSLRVGSAIVDASFTQVVKDRAEMRTEASKSAIAAEKAGKHNAGMQKGRQPAPTQRQTTPPAPTVDAGKSRKPDWDGPLTEYLAENDIPRH